MNKANLKRFRKVFEAEKRSLLFNDRVVRDDFNVNVDDRFDEVDQASTDVLMSMGMRLRNRETLYIKKIDEALRRIEEETLANAARVARTSSCEGLRRVPRPLF